MKKAKNRFISSSSIHPEGYRASVSHPIRMGTVSAVAETREEALDKAVALAGWDRYQVITK